MSDKIMTTLYGIFADLVVFCYLLHSDCAPKTAAPQAQDDDAAKKLWDLSASMVGLA